MELIEKNPYRIVGLISGFSERELQRQKTKITRYIGIGKSIETQFDFPFFKAITRDENSVRNAFSQIEQNQGKVNHSLFWFLNCNSFDETAINYLVNGDRDKAFQIWEKVILGKEINSKNFSCFNNISTLQILGNSYDEIKEGIQKKINLIDSNYLKDFTQFVSDQTYSNDNQNIIEHFIDQILIVYKEKYSNSEIFNFFENGNATSKKLVSKKFTEEIVVKIETNVEKTKNSRKDYKRTAYQKGLQLLSESKEDLNKLKMILGSEDIEYKLLTDSVSKEIMQCAIDYFIEIGQPEDQIDKVLDLLNKTKMICLNQVTIDRINENITELNNIKYTEIQFIIAVIKSVKEAIINLEIENRGKSIFDHQTINEQKVDEIFNKEISSARLQELIESNKKTYIDEFISLATFVRDKQSTVSINRIVDFLYNTLPANHEFVIIERVRRKKREEDTEKRRNENDLRKKREAEKNAKRKEEEREIKRKEEFDNAAWFISIGLGVIAGLIVLGWATTVGEEFYGFIMGSIFGVLVGRIVFYIVFLPCIAIARIFYILTK
jgi:hypothetical protein